MKNVLDAFDEWSATLDGNQQDTLIGLFVLSVTIIMTTMIWFIGLFFNPLWLLSVFPLIGIVIIGKRIMSIIKDLPRFYTILKQKQESENATETKAD